MPSTRTLLSLVVLLSACGSSSAKAPPQSPQVARAPEPERSIPVHRKGGAKLTAAIGSAGGTLELDNGARLEIPAGALESPVEITFAAGARTTAFSNKEHERPLGPTLEIAPELALSSPAKVSVPALRLPEGFAETDLALGLEQLGDQRAVEMQGTQTRWDYFPAASQAGRAVAELAAVPGYRLQFLVSKSE
jgi:hypothetical protein